MFNFFFLFSMFFSLGLVVVWYGMVCCTVCMKYEHVHDRLMSSICVYLSEGVFYVVMFLGRDHWSQDTYMCSTGLYNVTNSKQAYGNLNLPYEK